MHSMLYLASASLSAAALAAAVDVVVPASVPLGAARLDKAPVGISYEFFAFPSYRLNVSATARCERNLRDLSGTWPPVRIGGTTQDRALFDPALDAYVSYSVADPADAPADLTFGPGFLELAGEYEGRVTLGLNRGRNNLDNTIAAARAAVSAMPNLLAIELGNEPEYYPKDGQPIAAGTWDPATDAASQANWQLAVGGALASDSTLNTAPPVFEAGNSLESPDTWGARELIQAQNESAREWVKSYSHHNYPGGGIEDLMSHANVVSNVEQFGDDVVAAQDLGWEYVLGETNSATGGGAASVSPSFGAALWLADYALQAASANISRLYFHHGTVGNCQYCWWGRYSMGAPYYGAYFAASAFALGEWVVPLDAGEDAGAGDVGAYAVYDLDGAVKGVALLNTAYWDGSGERAGTEVVLRGLGSGGVKAKRLTSESGGATARVDKGQKVTFAGREFEDGTCVVSGEEVLEEVVVDAEGTARVSVGASEGVLVLL
ncbi:glycoside hydrolase family 79 protein [Aplosporella prunicola CBS 121167]|uniref:Glycoside hydrolase family 79 protein n=1 Tax=Aplosporella prunicola CBS 121167 TaxID=1176127 RepID=A0A6A6BRA1_9PEZI|nr:glycoside hydrolase family 79 protein [Aplosporella prunicola CBS 121167]KAF2145835.1 glycoside hydrolase family 79 protein [Aplosporella prunicola CBS 121167]